MDIESKKFVYATPRHFRAVYFVESDMPSKVLMGIIQRNLQVWGGRYNPIIPIRSGKLDDSYLPLLMAIDPDTVYYSQAVDLEEIKKLWFLNPDKYEKMDERGYPTCGGVNYHYLLNESNRDFMMYNDKLPILHIQGSYQIELKAKSFYETNFALLDLYANQEKLIRGFDVIPITKANHETINTIIAEKTPYFKSILSQLKINACIFRPKHFSITERFELIVSETDYSTEDLFYFWNRQQFIEQNRRLYQVVVSKADLKILLEDRAFEILLSRFAINNIIHLTSQTIATDKLVDLKNDLQEKLKSIRFDVITQNVFPYEILDYRYHNELKEERIKQIFTEDGDLLKLNAPKLTDRMPISGGLVYDVEIEYNVAGQSPESKLKLPFSYPLHKRRVNRFHDQSIFTGATTSSIDFYIPDNFEIFRERLQFIKGYDDNLVKTPIEYIRYSNAGQRLYALLNLFRNNWTSLSSTICDKLWLDIFRHTSDFKSDESNIPKGKGIFSHKDIIKEKTLLYEKYRPKFEEKAKKVASEVNANQMIDWHIKDDMESHVNPDLQELIEIGAVFMGIKVKCHTCGSNKWYSLKELQNKMPCKGCGTTVTPQMESPYYYRVNEIIVNNLLSDATGNSKDYDGNYVVFRALGYLKSGSRQGFVSCCPLDYATINNRRKKWTGDIDILALQDGKFILGEAKNDASEFSRDVLQSMIWLANNVKPDAIMVAHNVGTLGDVRLKKLRDGIQDPHCEIIHYQVSPPWYHHGGLFDLP